ncbi:hypothetical protein AX774_g4205, partial [Zancudomyces culisetae]
MFSKRAEKLSEDTTDDESEEVEVQETSTPEPTTDRIPLNMNFTFNRGIPDVAMFDSNTTTNVEEWLDRYELMARINSWMEKDKIDFLELFLTGKDLRWYKINKSKLEKWKKVREEFLEKFE